MIDADLIQAINRQVDACEKRDQTRDAPLTQQKSGRSANHGEQQALSKELAYQAAPARPERSADGRLPLPRRGTRQQQARHVGAGNQQHKRHRA